MAAIVVQALEKVYGSVRAVDGLSFTVAEGEVFAVLGPNGAGKTTTVEILTGHRRRSAGLVRVLGFDQETGGREYRERIGVVLQSAGFEEEFTVAELVRLQATSYPRVNDPDELIDLVGLTDKRNAGTKSLSGGQRRRLDLALGLVGAPDLLCSWTSRPPASTPPPASTWVPGSPGSTSRWSPAGPASVCCSRPVCPGMNAGNRRTVVQCGQ